MRVSFLFLHLSHWNINLKWIAKVLYNSFSGKLHYWRNGNESRHCDTAGVPSVSTRPQHKQKPLEEKNQSRIAIKIYTKFNEINMIALPLSYSLEVNILDWNPIGLLQQLPMADNLLQHSLPKDSFSPLHPFQAQQSIWNCKCCPPPSAHCALHC